MQSSSGEFEIRHTERRGGGGQFVWFRLMLTACLASVPLIAEALIIFLALCGSLKAKSNLNNS
jgi:hypothetical protein